jgi:hypothetical protein
MNKANDIIGAERNIRGGKMQRIISITVAVLLIAAAAAYYVMRTDEKKPPPANTEMLFRASAFLAPGAQASLPTNVRVKVTVSSNLLPISSAELDPDGDRGTMPTRTLDISLWQDAGIDGTGTNLYFDIPWDAPAEAQPLLVVHSAKGNYVTPFYVNVASLQPWE